MAARARPRAFGEVCAGIAYLRYIAYVDPPDVEQEPLALRQEFHQPGPVALASRGGQQCLDGSAPHRQRGLLQGQKQGLDGLSASLDREVFNALYRRRAQDRLLGDRREAVRVGGLLGRDRGRYDRAQIGQGGIVPQGGGGVDQGPATGKVAGADSAFCTGDLGDGVFGPLPEAAQHLVVAGLRALVGGGHGGGHQTLKQGTRCAWLRLYARALHMKRVGDARDIPVTGIRRFRRHVASIP